MDLLRDIFTSMRTPHWLKNVLIFFPMIFSAQLPNKIIIVNLTQAFVLFSLISSAIYIINDLIDIPFDKIQPLNKNRPLSKQVNEKNKWIFAVFAIFLIMIVLLYSFNFSRVFFMHLASYLVLNLVYSFFLKKLFLVDVLILAFFLVFRLNAGEAVCNFVMPFKFFLGFFPLFMALGFLKRYTEINSNHILYKRTFCPGRPYRIEHSAMLWYFSCILNIASLVVFLNICGNAFLEGQNNFALLFLFLLIAFFSRRLWIKAKAKKINGDFTMYAISEIF